MSAKHTPEPGHKRGSVGVKMSCECGWQSVTCYGKGALREANGQWRSHIESLPHRVEARRAAISKATGEAQ